MGAFRMLWNRGWGRPSARFTVGWVPFHRTRVGHVAGWSLTPVRLPMATRLWSASSPIAMSPRAPLGSSAEKTRTSSRWGRAVMG